MDQAPSGGGSDHRPYVCGNCRARVQVKLRENVLCPHCGYRIVYKPRERVGRVVYVAI